jgi:hypothetical protein
MPFVQEPQFSGDMQLGAYVMRQSELSWVVPVSCIVASLARLLAFQV